MVFQNVINSFKILYAMDADTAPLVAQLAEYCHSFAATVLPSEDTFIKMIEDGKVASMHVMKEPNELDLGEEFVQKLYTIAGKPEEYDGMTYLLQNVHVVDNEYVACIYQICYLIEEDDFYGYSPTGKCYQTGYSHWAMYINGQLVNQESIDMGNDYHDWHLHLLRKRVEYKQVV